MNKFFETVLHPIQTAEKWALQRLLKRVVEQLPVAESKLIEIWESHEDEIYKKVGEAIKNTVVSIVQKALEKQENKADIPSEN